MTNDDKEYEEFLQLKENELKPALTDDFLSTLAKSAKTYGWSGDHTETESFVKWCYDIAGKEAPDLTPYTHESD